MSDEKKNHTSVVCKLERICKSVETRDLINKWVKTRTAIGFEVCIVLQGFVLKQLEEGKCERPMLVLDQTLIDHAWCHVSKIGKSTIFAPPKEAKPRKKKAKPPETYEEREKREKREDEKKIWEEERKAAVARGEWVEEAPVQWLRIIAAEKKRQHEAMIEFAKQYRTWRPPDFVVSDRGLWTEIRQVARDEQQTRFKNNVLTNFKTRTCKWIRHRLGEPFLTMQAKERWKTVEKIYHMAWGDDTYYNRNMDLLTQLDQKHTRAAAESKRCTDLTSRIKRHKGDQMRPAETDQRLAVATDAKAEAFGCLEMWNSSLALIAEMRQIKIACQIPFPHDENLQNVWFRYLPWLWKVLRDFESWLPAQSGVSEMSRAEKKRCKGLKLFNLIPQQSVRPHYIHLSQSFVKILGNRMMQAEIDKEKSMSKKKQLAKTKSEFSKGNDYASKLAWWNVAFDMTEVANVLRGKDIRFGFYMKTNGHAVSIARMKPGPKKKTAKEAKKAKSKAKANGTINRPQDVDSDGLKTSPIVKWDGKSRLVGIDPGRIDLVSCVDTQNNVMRVSNAEYHSILGTKKRAKERLRTIEEAGLLEINNKTDVTDYQSSKTSSFAKFERHARHELKHMHRLIGFFNQQPQKQMTLDAYRLKNRALDRVCQMITLGDKNTFVAFGGASFSSSSAGSRASPGGALKKRLLLHTKNVSEVNEYKTSQMCPGCDSDIPMIAPVHCTSFEERKNCKQTPDERVHLEHKTVLKAPLTFEQKREINAKSLALAKERWKQPRGTRPQTIVNRTKGALQCPETWKHLPRWPSRRVLPPEKGVKKKKKKCPAKVQQVRYREDLWSELKCEEKERQERKEDVWFKKVPIRAVRCCKQCKRIWNRDTAAAINILQLYKELVAHDSRPARFKPPSKRSIS